MKLAAVRWIGAFRRQGRWDGYRGLLAELTARDQRPAEPLWHGRSLMVWERPDRITLGVGYGLDAIVKAWWSDAWSEPVEAAGGVAVHAHRKPVVLRTHAKRCAWWRDWQSYSDPVHHGEVVLSPAARPLCIVVATGPIQGIHRWMDGPGLCGRDLSRDEIAYIRAIRRNALEVARRVSDETGLRIAQVRGRWRAW